MQTEPEKQAGEGSSGELAQSHSVSALTLPDFTLANGTLEKISLFLKKINWWGKKKKKRKYSSPGQTGLKMQDFLFYCETQRH